jgi:hypothetical protein
MMRAAIRLYEHPDFELPQPSSAKRQPAKMAMTGLVALVSATAAAVYYVTRNPTVQETYVAVG